MKVLSPDERTLNELDHVRLERLIRNAGDRSAERSVSLLEGILDNAELVAPQKMPEDVVTMYSQVELSDLETERRYKLTVCYPPDADPASGFVSVMSPVGASLLGRRVGSIARWQTPTGESGAAKVTALLFQPESTGDYTT